MSKKKVFCILSLLLVFLFCAPVNTYATSLQKDTIPEEKIIYINGLDDVLYLTEEDIFSGQSTQTQILRIQRSYWKEIELVSVHEKPNPSFYDWPQTVYYTEPNPYAPGNANGTLSLQGFSRVPDSIGSTWYVRYAGYLYYYVD